MNLKQTKYVRVIDSTRDGSPEVKALIGKVLEVKDINYSNKTITVWDSEERFDYEIFNFSDVQEVFPEAVVDGYVLGVGDKINADTFLYCCKLYLKECAVVNEFDANDCYFIDTLELKDITPLYTPKKETVEGKIEELNVMDTTVGDLYVVKKLNELVKAINKLSTKENTMMDKVVESWDEQAINIINTKDKE